jgi:hypothetical protein
MSRTLKVQTDRRRKRETSEAKNQEQLIITKNSSWQAKQSIPHTTVTFYGDCMKMCEDFAPNFGEQNLVVT